LFQSLRVEGYTDSFLLRPNDLCSEKPTRIALQMISYAVAVALLMYTLA